MKPENFSDNMPGKLVNTPQGYLAFVPDPLPPDLSPSWKLSEQTSKADRALSELAGIARTLPNPHLLISPFIRREAVLSSRIEGTQTTLSELFQFEAAGKLAKSSLHVQEVHNYVMALEYGLSRLRKLPVSLRLIREMHKRLMEGVKGSNLTPGRFRRSQNYIGPEGCHPKDATFVPPPPSEMKKSLSDMEKHLHSEPFFPPLIRLALIHYQFEAIHPFFDGNGRIGRLLITLLLCADRILPQPLLYLSAFFERNRRDYYSNLLNVSQTNNWTEWIMFFLRGVEIQAKDALKRSKLLMDLLQNYRERLKLIRSSMLAMKLLDNLFEYPATTARGACDHLNATVASAQKNVDKLVEIGLLKEVTGKKRNRIYIAEEIIKIVEAEDVN